MSGTGDKIKGMANYYPQQLAIRFERKSCFLPPITSKKCHLQHTATDLQEESPPSKHSLTASNVLSQGLVGHAAE